MKTKRKDKIIVICFFLSIIGIMLGLFSLIFMNSVKPHNICAVVYGDELGNVWDWNGHLDYEYTAEYFNETYVACCIKERFINSNGEIQYEKCTGVYPIK